MALVKCRECGKKISALAKACPNCGCPRDDQMLLHGKFPGKKCVNCQALIPVQADYCPKCSAKQTGPGTVKGASPRIKKWVWVVIVVVVLIVGVNVFKRRPASPPTDVPNKPEAPAAEQAKQSEPATATTTKKADKDLPRKLAVATYFESALQKQYGTATVSVKGDNDEILSITMIRVTEERIQTILDAGLYREAKKAKFRQIVFTDFSHKDTVVSLR